MNPPSSSSSRWTLRDRYRLPLPISITAGKKRPRFPLSLLLVLGIVAILLIASSAVAQEMAVAPSVSASTTTASPFHNHAGPAPATPKPRPQGSSSAGPSPDRKWEVEVHGGGMLVNHPSGGTGALPGPGVTCCAVFGPTGPTSRAISSWYFGDGALLFSQVESTHRGVSAIVPLDPILTSSVAQRQPGGSFGGRLSYDITPRFAAELTFDYGLGSVDLSSRARTQIAATSAGFVNSFQSLFSLFPSPTFTATSTPTIRSSDGHQVSLTSALNVNLLTRGRVIPYVTGGVGFIRNVGDLPFATLTGNYTFSSSVLPGAVPVNETDSVRLHYRANDTSFMGVVGGGVKFYVTEHWGLRLDVRTHISANSIDNLLDATPSRVTGTPGLGLISFSGNNSLVFSSDASLQNSLSGPAITNFRTFTSSGTQFQIGLTGGLFWRF